MRFFGSTIMARTLLKMTLSMALLLLCMTKTVVTQNTTGPSQVSSTTTDSVGVVCRKSELENESLDVIYEDRSREEDLQLGTLHYSRSASPLTGVLEKRLKNCGGASGRVQRPNRDIGNCLVSNWKGTRSQHNCPGKYYLSCEKRVGYCGQTSNTCQCYSINNSAVAGCENGGCFL